MTVTVKLKNGEWYEIKNVKSYIFNESENTYEFMFIDDDEKVLIAREEIISISMKE